MEGKKLKYVQKRRNWPKTWRGKRTSLPLGWSGSERKKMRTSGRFKRGKVFPWVTTFSPGGRRQVGNNWGWEGPEDHNGLLAVSWEEICHAAWRGWSEVCHPWFAIAIGICCDYPQKELPISKGGETDSGLRAGQADERGGHYGKENAVEKMH